MTVTLDRLSTEIQQYAPQAERELTAETVEQEVWAILDDLLDPTGALHREFYRDPGVFGVEHKHLQEVASPNGDCKVLLKDETDHTYEVNGSLEHVSAFKRRGAFLAILRAKMENPWLDEVSVASSGNHAMAAAAACRQLGMNAAVFMSESSEPVKQEALTTMGAQLNTTAPNLAVAMDKAQLYAAESPITLFVHPYDDYAVLAGQATSALEVLLDLQERAANGELDLLKGRVLIAVPVGGGGYLAATGIVLKWAKDRGYVGENVFAVGVQAQDKANNQLCDGTMATTGSKASAIINDTRFVQGVATVHNEEIAEAMVYLEKTTGKKVEPAGALAATLATTGIARGGDVLVAMVSGASVSDEKYNLCMDLSEAVEAENTGYTRRSAVVHDVAAAVMAGSRVWCGR